MFRVLLTVLLLGSATAIYAQSATCPTANGACGIAVPTGTATAVTTQLNTGYRIYERIINSGASSSGTAWCSRAGTPSVNGAGSFALAPFGNSLGEPSIEEYGTGQSGATAGSQASTFVPQGVTMCVSDGGTSGTAAANLTVETR